MPTLMLGGNSGITPSTSKGLTKIKAYDSNDVLLVEGSVSGEGIESIEVEGSFSLCIDGEVVKAGEVLTYKVLNGEPEYLINGNPMSEEQLNDWQSIMNKVSYSDQESKTEYKWDSITLDGESYSLTQILNKRGRMDSDNNITGSYSVIVSFDKAYDGLSYIAIYYDTDATGKISNGV